VTASLLLGACGDDGDDDATTTTAGTDAPADGPSGETVIEVTGDLEEKPEIELNDQEPVDELIIQDIVEGDGAEVQPGATVTAHYVGQLLDGTQFDASWDRGEPSTFPLGQVITGWQEGLPGMKVGGRRLLVIPGDMAYGSAGRPGIPPDATLVFVIDMVAAT
jgi:peptidylprolyl isomerase